MVRVGQGFDVHKFVLDRPLIIGGVKIDYEYGLEGHSDADVLIHAIISNIGGHLFDIWFHLWSFTYNCCINIPNNIIT